MRGRIKCGAFRSPRPPTGRHRGSESLGLASTVDQPEERVKSEANGGGIERLPGRGGDAVDRIALLLILALLVPLKLWRASLESSLWIDETYSLVLSGRSLARIIDLTTVDCHPPGYYIALKYWMGLGRVGGGQPGILWARSLNLCFWGALVAVAWLGGRRLLGRHGPALMLAAVAASAQVAQASNDLRSYGIALPALFACFVILMVLRGDGEARRKSASAIGLWLLYAVCASVALWTHLLSAPVLGVLAVLWVFVAIERRRLRSPFFMAGAVAHVVILVGFLPWLLRVHQQIAYLNREVQTWMTPPTLMNWLRVFALWYPFGKVGTPGSLASNVALVPGMLSFLVPVAAAAASAARKTGASANRSALLLGLSGAATALASVTVLWAIDRLGITQTFHGPRYPALTAPFWAAGLIGFSLWATERFGWKRRRAWVLLAPWFACSVVGQVRVQARELQSPLLRWSATVAGLLPEPGQAIYIMPSEMLRFYRKTLARYAAGRLEDLARPGFRGGDVTILNVNPWPEIDRRRDVIIRAAIEERLLCDEVERSGFPGYREDYVVYRLRGFARTKAVERILANAFGSKREGLPREAVSAALAEEQLRSQGWSALVADRSLRAGRWATVTPARVRFDRPVGPGTYWLHFCGARTSSPWPAVAMEFRFRGESKQWLVRRGSGRFHIRLRIELTEEHRRPVLLASHPLWVPSEGVAPDRPRRVGFRFERAWLERIGR